jgi:A/G-specific adenine glycosylase
MVRATRQRAGSKRGCAIARALLRWYDEHHRDLPWRALANPYATWVSEIMLQQTQVATVIPYFERWMKRFPTVSALAEARQDAVLSAWQGLGYYSRARHLHQSAQQLRTLHAGKLPADPRALRQLPGIGRYTAGAIASIAFDLPEPAVDGNVMRVIARLQALRGDPRLAPMAEQIWDIAGDWVRCESPQRFNQALMELGALLCTPTKPQCSRCPLSRQCRARQLGLSDALPELHQRPKPEKRQVVVLVATKGEALLVVRQPASAPHWANLFVLPHAEYAAKQNARAEAARLLECLDPRAALDGSKPIARFTYPITRFRFEATAYRVNGIRTQQLTEFAGRYATVDELAELALPAPHRRLCQQLRDSAEGPGGPPSAARRAQSAR